jgi:hypothetical protein
MSLPELEGGELRDFCAEALTRLAHVVSDAHRGCGASYDPVVECNHDSKQYRALRESQLFPEVLYIAKPKRVARGRVSITRSPCWPENYASMLIYSLAGRCLRLRNSVFFDDKLADIQPTRRSKELK